MFFSILFSIFFLIALAMTGLWIWTIIHILRSNNKDDNTRIIWLLVVIFIPGMGTILYWLLGNEGKGREDQPVQEEEFL